MKSCLIHPESIQIGVVFLASAISLPSSQFQLSSSATWIHRGIKHLIQTYTFVKSLIQYVRSSSDKLTFEGEVIVFIRLLKVQLAVHIQNILCKIKFYFFVLEATDSSTKMLRRSNFKNYSNYIKASLLSSGGGGPCRFWSN